MDISTKQSIGWDKARDFLEKLIDEYKYGEISADDVCSKADDFWRDYPYMDEFEYVDSKFDD